VKWISLQDSHRLDRLYISDTNAKITPAGLANSSAKLHPAGTVVLSRDAGVGKSAIMTDCMAVSQHFMAWVCGSSLNNRFLFYWLQANKPEFERIAMGNTIKTIGLSYFRQLRVPLPCVTEQEAIAEALSDTDALVESLENLIAKKRQLKEGVMQELLTGKRRLPGFDRDWAVKPLGSLFSFSGGYSASRDQLSGEGHCYLHYGDIHKSSKTFIDLRAEYQDIPKLNVPLKRVSSASLLSEGDVVFVDASEDDEGASRHVVIANQDTRIFIAGLHTIVAKSLTEDLANEYRRA
jgi:restriction endonuclease S subunit